MKPRIVFLINSLAGGGAERIMTRLLASSAAYAQSYDLHLVLLDDEPDAYSLPDWLTVHRLNANTSFAKSLAAGLRCLHRLQPAVCLSFLTRSNLVNVAAAALLGHPAIISERVNPSSHHRRTMSGTTARLLTRTLYPRARHIICPSSGVATDLIQHFGVSAAKTTVIANPVDAEALAHASAQPAALPTPRPYIVAMGRLVATKNFALLLHAFAASTTTLDLVIIGDGPLRAALTQQAQQFGLGQRVHFTGFLPNPFPTIRNARAYVLPSSAEGFPNGLVEAMALGVPVIATNCRSGPSEILDDQPTLEIAEIHRARYGLLVPVNDATSMAKALSLIASDEAHALYAKRAAEGAARYALQPAVDAYWRVLADAKA